MGDMTSEKPRGILFVLVGPGGTGKNTLMNAVMTQHDNLKQLATATTRKIRPNEKQGREHLFVSEARFREMIENNKLLEHQEVTPGKFYGIPRASVTDAIDTGENLIADIEVLGAQILSENFSDDTMLIFVTVPGETLEERLTVLRERMTGRFDEHDQEADEERIQQRLKRARELEFPFMDKCQHVIVNDDMDKAIAELNKIVSDALQHRTSMTDREQA